MEVLLWRDSTAKLIKSFIKSIKKYKKYTDENSYILYIYLRLLAREDLVIIVFCRYNPTLSSNSNYQLPERLILFAISIFKKIGKSLSW